MLIFIFVYLFYIVCLGSDVRTSHVCLVKSLVFSLVLASIINVLCAFVTISKGISKIDSQE